MKSKWIILIALGASCRSSFLKTPAVPGSPMPVSSELEYIVRTDQVDRKQNASRALLLPHSNNIQQWMIRDSIRLRRVKEIVRMDSVVTDDDKWNAGLIFLHGGGKSSRKDSGNCKMAYFLFDDLYLHGKSYGMRKNGETWRRLALEQLKEFKTR